MTLLDHLSDGAKHAIDALAAVTVLAWLIDLLPPIATGLTIVWISLQIYGWFETRLKAAKPPQN